MAAFARPAFSMVCSESVSSLLGNVVNKANVCAAYCGRALKKVKIAFYKINSGNQTPKENCVGYSNI